MNATEKCHRPDESAVTFRLPKAYDGISEWAIRAGFHAELEVAYFCLGRPDDPRYIRNLANEFTQELSQPILAEWGDRPIVSRLSRFSHALASTTEQIPKADSAMPPKKHAERTRAFFNPLKDRYFLLAMIVNPRSYSDDEQVSSGRQRLRLWLFLHAAVRVANNGCIADQNVSIVARHITLDRIDKNWGLVDRLLSFAGHETEGYPRTFEWFNYAIERAAHSLLTGSNKSEQGFLGALTPIARGYTFPIPISSEIDSPGNYLNLDGYEVENLFQSDPEHPITQALPGIEGGGEDETDDILVNVDPSDTDEEQALTSRSVFLYSAEESQYLPWSWDKLLPPEIEQLNLWIDEHIDDEDLVYALGATIAKTATKVGVSLFNAEKIPITDSISENWSITTDFRYIQRLQPRRHSSWSPQDAQQEAEIQPFINSIKLQLTKDITAALSRIPLAPPERIVTLGTMWRAVNSKTKLTVWFDGVARERFPRVTSGKLTQVAAQRVFEQTGDHNLSRMLTAAAQSGLPAACGYANWDVTTIAKGLDLQVITRDIDLSTLMLGSLLAPLESVLSNGVAEAKKLVAEANDLVSFHNRYTQYCLLALYAGTGSRYLKSPFENLGHFNLQLHCLYINDKTDGARHDGRIVPLPRHLVELVSAYLLYLSSLQMALQNLRPELAKKIHDMIEENGADLPLFFLLDEQLYWHETSDDDVLGLPLVTWTLPPNLFRHRYSQQLYRAGVLPDVIDGWMGHSERGGATYGDFSPRCWHDDAQEYKQVYNSTFEALGFDVIQAPNLLPEYLPPERVGGKFKEPTAFGAVQRRAERRLRYKKARKIAQQEIKLFIGNEKLEEIALKEIEKLGNRMLKRENGLPHPDAGIRFRALEQFLRSHDSKHTRSIKKKMLKRNEDRNYVESTLPSELTRYGKAKIWAEDTSEKIQKGQVNKTTALILGTTLLCIEKRLSYPRLLSDVLQGNSFRLVQDSKKYYLEYSEEWDVSDFFAPVQRHEISYKTASLLDHGLSNSRLPEWNKIEIPDELRTLGKELWPDQSGGEITVPQLMKQLGKCVEQANLIQLPGMVAAALSERMPPTSLNWADVVRIRSGECIKLPEEIRVAPENEEFRFNQRSACESDRLALQDNAKALYKVVTELLSDYQTKSCKETAKKIQRTCETYRGKVSTAVLMMPFWISQLIIQGQGRGKHHKPYQKSSVQNYFSSLRLAFQGKAYECDLLSMDSDAITDLYHGMVEARRDRGKEVGYFGQRLKDFHRWAARHGVENPDWPEIDTEDNHRSVSPGCFAEKDYFACQEYIETHYGFDNKVGLYLGFVLLLVFRFGLRSGEAIGLRRQDWCEWQGLMWVLVRDNYLRQLKRNSSRRAVPFLFCLTNLERELIDRLVANYDSVAGLEKNAPLLCDIRQGRIIQDDICLEIQETLTAIMRSVTGSQSLTPHHGRHAFHNQIAPILLGFESPTSIALCKDIDPEGLRELVLGVNHTITLRSSTGLSRLMGHASPSSGLKNYNHLMTEWADALTPVKSERALVIKGIVNTKDFERIKLKEVTKAPEISFKQPSLFSTFKLLRLVSQGRSYQQAGKLLSLPPAFVSSIESNFNAANQVMRFKTRGENAWFKGKDSPNAILHYITEPAWDRLLELAESLDDTELRQNSCYLPVDEVPLLMGMNRQIKMSHDRHCEIVKACFEIFQIGENSFDVTVAKDDETVTKILQDHGFRVKPIFSFHENEKPLQIDVFNRTIEERRGRIYEYGVVIFSQQNHGVIRNAYELAVGFLASASFLTLLPNFEDKKMAAV